MSDLERGIGIGPLHELTQQDWLFGQSIVDLNRSALIPDKARVLIRISVILDGDNGDSEPYDAMGIDYVKVFAGFNQ